MPYPAKCVYTRKTSPQITLKRIQMEALHLQDLICLVITEMESYRSTGLLWQSTFLVNVSFFMF